MTNFKKFTGWSILLYLFLGSVYIMAQPTVQLEVFARRLNKPVDIENMGDDRLFVVEKNGKIRIIDPMGNIQQTPFLDITDRVQIGGNEMGFLGLAFHPNYKENGYFYVNYTALSPRRTIISRFERDSINPDKALANSEKVLLVIEQPFSNHNGGCIKFGPDGYLYIGMGDGGSARDPGNRAQDPKVLLGKMLRIDVDHGDPYSIPPSNPYAKDTTGLAEIWAMGLRNPWRFSFDRKTGDLYIADVGQNQVEEIDYEPYGTPGGRNYGWRCYEGNDPFRTNGCSDASDYKFPVHQYRHVQGHCSITGGYVYRGHQYPELEGLYFYADFCSGFLGALERKQDSTWSQYDLGFFKGYTYASFGENNQGELFIAGLGGEIYRLVGDSTLTTYDKKGRTPLRIFPNPTQDHVSVQYHNAHKGGLLLTLYNLQGEIIYRQRYPEGKSKIDLWMSDYAAGIYLLVVKSDLESIVVKVVKH